MSDRWMRAQGTCHVCNEPVSGAQILGHLRLMHPDTFQGTGPPRWPDGSVAIAVLPSDARDLDEPVEVDETEGQIEEYPEGDGP